MTMTMYQIQDRLTKTKTTKEVLDNGFMRVTGTAAVVGRMDYPHLGRKQYPETGYKAYVPASELKASAQGLLGMPVTDGHPPVDVDDTNFSKFSKGNVYRVFYEEETERLRFEEMITDGALKQKVVAKKKIAKSPGYKVTFVPVEDDPEGDKARALGCNVVQRGRIYNHNAVVFDGRGGPTARIDDSMDEETKQKIAKIDDLETGLKAVADALENLTKKMDEKEEEVEDKDKDKEEEPKPFEAKDSINAYIATKKVADALAIDVEFDGDIAVYQRAVCDALTGEEAKVQDSEVQATLALAPRLLEAKGVENLKDTFRPTKSKVKDGAPKEVSLDDFAL